jgi:hypothetical protein
MCPGLKGRCLVLAIYDLLGRGGKLPLDNEGRFKLIAEAMAA